MESFIRYRSRSKNTTLLKYFFSYFILLSLLFLGFFLTVRIKLETIYTKSLYTQAEKRLKDVKEDFVDSLVSINQIQSLLIRDINLILSRHSNNQWYRYQAAKKLNEYNIGNSLIDSICYIDLEGKSILSSGRHIKMNNDSYEVYTNTGYIEFHLEKYTDTRSNQLIALNNQESELFLYLPYNNNIQNYYIFFILDLKEVKSLIDNAVSPGITSVGILDGNNKIITASSTDVLEPHLERLNGVDGFYSGTNIESLYAINNLPSSYSIVAVLSNQDIIDLVNAAFRNTYLLLLLVFGIGMLLIMFFMRITYWPLYKLTQKLVPTFMPNQGYVEQLDVAFTNISSENKELQEKIDSYRLSMQKSILDSIVTDNNKISLDNSINIDELFNMDIDSHIFIVKVQATYKKNLSLQNIKEIIDSSLPGENPSTILEATKDYIILLIHYIGIEQNKEEVLHLFMCDLYESVGCKTSISNSATSPLEIPSLYENSITASNYWDYSPVVSYNDISHLQSKKGSLAYPHAQLNLLSNSLHEQDFDTSKSNVDILFSLLDKTTDSKSPLPDFFIRCVMIDILSLIANSMNRINVKFTNYSDLYFNALYLCRSSSYSEKRNEIHKCIINLITTYESEFTSSTIQAVQIQAMIEENFTSPDFSIGVLADNFEVSIAYMSYVFKKNFNENFSDYLWSLRMEKAMMLLKNTNKTIDEVSNAVGYLNTSSFRRRFKQETNMTPSQYRKA